MQNNLMNIVVGYMDWVLFVTMMEIAESVTVREMVDCVANNVGDCCWQWVRLLTVLDIVGDCWLLQMVREIADCVKTLWEIVDCYRWWGRLLTVSQTVSEICDHYRPWERLLTLVQTIREMADCVKMTVVVDCYNEGDYWLCHRPWGRLLTVAQTMREIADCGTDPEGDRLCYWSWGLLIVSQKMWEIADCGTDHEGSCCLCHNWPWIQHITCALRFWHCIMSILYSLSLPWITDGFEPSSIQNLIKQCCLTFLLTSVNTIWQYDETVKCMLEKRHLKWLYKNDTDPCHCLLVTMKIPGQIWATFIN